MKRTIDIKQFRFYLVTGGLFLLIWILNVLATYRDQFVARSANYLWATLYVIVINFILFEYTLPRLSWKKFFLSFFLLFVHLLLYSLGLYVWRTIGIALHIYTSLKDFGSVGETIEYHFPFSIISVVFFAVARHVYNYIKLRQAAQQLRIEKQQAELNYLKSQTNPHFLFNTLNNIYSLARDKSDVAPESILRLSKILRFMLYETGGAYIAIEQELKIISDYIALEKLRYDESLRINFNHDVEDMKQALPPLLLIPLVENAFKHGVSETRSHPFIDIHLSVNKRQLSFLVKNSVENHDDKKTARTSIGLSNLRRQLELLYKDFDLSHQGTDSVFTASLKINLASHV
jgi:two-component system, LytTR family, sensor kinase